MRRCTVFSMLFLILMVPGSIEARVAVDLKLDRSEALLTDSVRMVVGISGSRNTQSNPVLKGLEDFVVRQGGTSSRVEIINGKVSTGIDYTYYLQPKKTGTFQIGPAEVTIEGKRYRSPIRTLSVVKQAGSEGTERRALFLRAEISAKEVYVDEQAVYTLKLYRRANIRDISLGLPENDRLVFKQLGKPREYRSVINGQSYEVLEVRYAVVSAGEGSHEIGPSKMNMTVLQTGNRNRRSLFDDPFFSFSSGRPITLASESLELNVLPLPEAGKPGNFSGLVGTFSIESQLEPTTVPVGESATLTVRVTGQGNVQRIPDLKFHELEGAKVYADQPVMEVTQGDSGLKGAKTMKWALVPEKAGELILSPLSVSYFDPKSRRYQTRKTMPLPLTVLPAKMEAIQTAAADPKDPEAGTTHKEEVKQLGRDILPVHTSVKDLTVAARLQPKAGLLCLFTFTPLCIYLIAFYTSRIRKQSMETQAANRARKAMKNFTRRYRRGNLSAGELLNAVRDYLNERCGLSLGALTSEEATAILEARGVKPETRKRLRSRIQALEMAVYSGKTDESADTGDDLVKIMQHVNRQLR